MKSCFGYVRVSTAKQGEGVSLEAQREAIESFAGRNDISITQWFEEKETAAKSGRPLFDAMIKSLRHGKADGVVIHKIDRSARNFHDWAKMGELADAGIDVHFATEALDFRSRGGRLSADIQAVIAADYIRNLREETKKGINGRLKQGLYPFAAPIGYLNNGGGKPKTIDPVRGVHVRHAFELYAGGQHSIRSLRMEMKIRGLRNAHEKPLSKRGIETVLNNPFYCGLMRIKSTGQIYKGVHEPLISPRLFEIVQQVKSGKSGKKVTRHNHVFRGLFRCALCKSAMIPELQKMHVYYRCQTRKCVTKCVREEQLEDAIHAVLNRTKFDDDQIFKLTDAVQIWCEGQPEKDTSKSLAIQLDQIKARLDRLTDALIDSLIDEETYSNRKQSLLLDEARVEEQMQIAAKILNRTGELRKFLERIKNLADTYVSAIGAEKRQIVKMMTSNRTVAGKNIYLEPANWLLAIENALTVPFGAPHRPTSRNTHRIEKEHIDMLWSLMDSEEIQTSFAEL